MSDARQQPHLAEWLRAVGVIPVVQLPEPDMAVPLAQVLAAAGIPILEVTFRAAGAAQAIANIRSAVPDALVGAGTVLSVEQANAAIDAGAEFVVAPGTNPRVVEHVLARGIAMLPGVASPSEIEVNLERGLRLLKFFPAEASGGTGFLRAVHGPFPSVQFVPSGGVTAGNMGDYLAQPNVAAVGGTWIAPTERLAAGDFTAIERAARDAAASVRKTRPDSRPSG